MADRDTIGVLLVCEDTLERAGLRALLGGRPDMKIMGEAGGLAELPQLAIDLDPDIIVDVERSLDARTADRAAKAISRVNSATTARMVILTSTLNEFAVDLLRSGDCAILDTKIGSDELVAAIRLTAAGYVPVKEKLVVDLARAAVRLKGAGGGALGHLKALTPQERRVMMLVSQGLSNPEIAAGLTLAESTVKSHVQGILRKLGLRDRAQIIIYAYEGGLVCPLR